MSCELVEALAVDLARGTLDPGPRETLLDHATRCPHCAARLEAERALSAALAALAAATEAESAPASVQMALQRALERRGGSAPVASATVAGDRSEWTRRARSAAAAWWITAAASVVGLGVFVSMRHPATPSARSIASPSPMVQEEPASFVLLGYGDPLAEGDSLHVMRVELAGSTLTDLGWAPQAGLDSGAVTADIVVGPDGIARAIRLVESPEREDEGGEGS